MIYSLNQLLGPSGYTPGDFTGDFEPMSGSEVRIWGFYNNEQTNKHTLKQTTPRGFISLPGWKAKYEFSGFITKKQTKKKKHTRGFISLPGWKAKYGFSGFITTKKQKMRGVIVEGIPGGRQCE